MHSVMRAGELQPSPGHGDIRGRAPRVGVSFLLVDSEPGAGPGSFAPEGCDRLDIVCIHAAPRMIQESLED